MARRTTTKRGGGKLTAKQDEVRRLLQGGQTIVEVAELMDTTPGAVKAQISRIRKQGVKVTARTGAIAPPAQSDGSLPAADEEPPAISVEDHMGIELARVDDRLGTVAGLLSSLGDEQAQLTDRKGRLEAARAELAPALSKPPLSAVA